MTQELRRHLEKLHDELSRQPQLDSETLESLRKLLAEISVAIERTPAKEPNRDLVANDFTGQLETMIARFETRHPQLTATLSKIATALADLGI